MKKLFIYYSLTGNGDEVASFLKDKGYEILKVKAKDRMPKSFVGRIMTGGFLATINYKAKLINFNIDVSKYDKIVIGSPVWNDRLSTPINSVLSKLDFNGKELSFIFYSGSGKANKATDKIIELYKNAKIYILKEPKKNEEYKEIIRGV